MNEKLAEALDYIDERKITAAATARRRRHLFLKAVAAAAVMALLLNLNLPFITLRVNASTVSEASGPKAPQRPYRDDFDSYEEFDIVWDAYNEKRNALEDTAISSLTELNGFLTGTTAAYAGSSDENRICSPINAFFSLAAMAEVTDGNSRQQILAALNAPDMDILRSRVEALWETVYYDDGNELCLLGSSLWLNEGLNYEQSAMDSVAHHHYTSVFQKDLSRPGAERALATWVDNQTGGLLKSNTAKMKFPEQPVLTLVSTVYLQSKWADRFSASKNTQGIFHAPDGDVEATYMNNRDTGTYFWSEDYGASYRWLENGCKMWFFLPDEGKGTADVLSNGEYLEILLPQTAKDESRYKHLFINWTVPKFDVSASADLSDSLRAVGVTDIFDPVTADFSAITADTPVCVTGVNQSSRVIIDEEGVKAANYIEFIGAGAAEPPTDEVDMVLDRPFVFVIATSEGIPLFTGVVNQP